MGKDLCKNNIEEGIIWQFVGAGAEDYIREKLNIEDGNLRKIDWVALKLLNRILPKERRASRSKLHTGGRQQGRATN